MLSKVVLQGDIIVPDADLEIVKSELLVHKRLTLEEQGCLTFSVTPDEHNINKFNVYETFIDESAFESHQSRVQCSKWGQVTQNVVRHYQINREALNI